MTSKDDQFIKQLPDTETLLAAISSLFLSAPREDVKERLAELICMLLMRDEKKAIAYMEQFKTTYPCEGPALVSVLVTSYNTADFILPCVQSILLQTYHNLELILVDDGSSDDTLKRLEEINDGRLKIFPFLENKGRVAALNKGLDMCNGAFIALMDSDDLASPLRIEKLLAYRAQENLDAVSSQLYEYSDPYTYSVSGFGSEAHELKARMLFYNSVPHAATLFSAESIRQIRYRENFPYAEDYEMLSRYVSTYSIGLYPIALYLYRRRGNSATGQANYAQATASQKAIIRHYMAQHLFEPTETELDFHLQMERNVSKPETDMDTLVAIRRWIYRILKANKTKQSFDQDVLKRILLKNYWSAYYYANTHHHGLKLALRLMMFQDLQSNIITFKESLRAKLSSG